MQMSHQQHQQVPGNYQFQPSQHQINPSFVQQQQMNQQQQILNPQQTEMGHFAQHRYDVLQQYYSQMGIHQQSGSPMGQPSAAIQQQLNLYPNMTQQRLVSAQQAVGDALSTLQSNPMLFPPQQTAAAVAPYYVSNPSVSELASLAAQHQYLIQQQYLNQQQQPTLGQQPQQRQLPPQYHHQLEATTSASTFSVSRASAPNTNISTTPLTPFVVPSSSSQLVSSHLTPQKSNVESRGIISQEKTTPQNIVEQTMQHQQQEQRVKTPEDARLLAQKELEAQAKRKAEEAEKESRIVQEELKRRQLSAKERAQNVQERIRSLPELHLAGCHTLSKVSMFLPFPAEMVSSSSTLLPCFDQQQTQLVLANPNNLLAEYLGTLMSDTTAQLRDIKLKQDSEEHEDQKETNLPMFPLIRAIQTVSQNSFSVDAGVEVEIGHLTNHAEASEQSATGVNNNTEEGIIQEKQQQEQKRLGEVTAQLEGDFSQQHEMCQQMISSVEKQPKGTTTKRKRDMVESLYDSLTGYFSTGQRKGRSVRTKQSGTDDDDQTSTTSNDKNSIDEHDEDERAKRARKRRKGSSPSEDDRNEFKQTRKQKERSPTPSEVINQRELEWKEREKQNEEKYRKRGQLQQENQKKEAWNTDVICENESFCRFTALLDQILEQMDEAMSTLPSTTNAVEEFGLLLERTQIEQMRLEAQKLKAWQKLSDVAIDRLVKLLAIMEKNIRDILTEDGTLAIPTRFRNEDDDSDETLQELIEDRLFRSVDAALISICIMTSKRMPKQILMEDIIERSIQLCKHCLQDIIYTSFDSTNKAKSRKSVDLNSSVPKRNKNFNAQLYTRLVDLMGYFAELAHSHGLTESIFYQLATLCSPPFFVENVPEIQMQAIKLLPIIFAKCPTLRKTILYELLNSLHRLPQSRTNRNSFRLNATEFIGNFTVLILQLIQSTVQLPTKKSYHHNNRDPKKILPEELDDRLVLDSFEEAKKLASFFLGGFLAKCTAKAEDDYRRLFDQFLQDLLIALYRPMWPVAEIMLTVLGNLLILHFRSKNFDLSLRVASLEYLGIIVARLRKDRIYAHSTDANAQDKIHLNTIVKSIMHDEHSYDPSYNVDDIDISHLSSSDKIRKLEQALFDYIIGTMLDGDISAEYILLFYAVEWYRDTVLDVEVVKERYIKSMNEGNISHKEKQKCEQKMFRIAEKGQIMKHFIIGLMDKQHIKRRMQTIMKNHNIMVESDAKWVVKFLAAKKELSQSFDIYLRKILEGFNPDLYPVAIRAKSMKCLAQIVEADYQVLMIPEVNKIVQDRLIDANASVREATFDLIGKCLVSKPNLLETYYAILINRTKDTAVAVRKRVIRILRDIVLSDQKNVKMERKSQVLSEILQRVNDEDGVKKLCLETFQQLWMQPTHDKAKLDAKVHLLVETAKYSITEGSLEHFDALISQLVLKSQDQSTFFAAKQLVDALVDYVLMLEKKAVPGDQMSDSDIIDSTKDYQAKLFATLTTLSFFSKACPEMLIRHIEVFVPYLSVTNSSNLESRVLNQIITMLEQIIPLMENYDASAVLIHQLDSRLNEIAKDGGMLLIASAISCMSAIHNKFQQEEQPGICKLFIIYYKYLDKCKREMERENPPELNPDKKPNLLRSLYSVGLMCRYFDFDALLNPTQIELLQINNSTTNGTENGTNENQLQIGIVRTSIFLSLFYFSRCPDPMISQKALIALGQLTAGNPELLRRDELKSMYMFLLNTDKRIYLQLKVQVLKNIASFLHAEEQRALRRAEHAKYEREKLLRQQEDDSLIVDSPSEQSNSGENDLKEMESNSSGLSSSVIQQYWNAILNCYFNNDEMVRINSAQVIRQTLEQGLVTPGSSVPTLIAMSTDPLGVVRSRIDPLIRDMNTKYKGLILSKAVPGVHLAFQLQKKIKSNLGRNIRGIRFNENTLNNSSQTSSSQTENKIPTLSSEAQALLTNFYVNIRTNRQNRRSFLLSVLRKFSEEHKEKVEPEEWVFLADNLAHFPYSVLDEPLYIIHQTNSIISISGQNILSQFRQLLIRPPDEQCPSGFSNANPNLGLDAAGVAESTTINAPSKNAIDELEEFSVNYINEHLPDDRAQIYELKRNSKACFILLHLKTFLIRMYGLKEDKIAEYSPSEAPNVYEKPITRRNIPVFSPDFILNELNSQHEPTITEEKLQIAEDFHKFYEMLLSLDEKKDEDEETSMMCEEIPTEEKESISNIETPG